MAAEGAEPHVRHLDVEWPSSKSLDGQEALSTGHQARRVSE